MRRRTRIGGYGDRKRSRSGGPRAHRIVVVILFCVGCMLVPSRTRAQEAAAEAPPGGHLVLRGADGSTRLAPVLEVDAALRVSGLVARGSVVQRFWNASAEWIEATYVFPLPEGAAVDGLRIRIGDRVIEGEIRERQEARRVYEAARQNGQRASLLEQQRPNAFTSRVANVAPQAEVEVEIDFQQTLRLDAGEFELRLPWIVAPRWLPPDATGEDLAVFHAGEAVPPGTREALGVALGEAPDVALAIDLDPGVPLASIESPTHRIDLEQIGLARLLVTLGDAAVPADRDFVLRWRPTEDAAPRAALFGEERDGEAYRLLMLLPPEAGPQASLRGAGREVIFVIDTSGSMGGPSIEQARAALRLAIARLDAADRFNVIAFDSDTRQLFARPRFAEPSAKDVALGWVGRLEASGGTNMLPALRAALEDADGGAGLRQVVFITDGCVGNERALFTHVKEQLGRSRLFTVGIGSAPNGFFMEGAARFGRGGRVSIASPEEVGAKMQALFAKLERPVLTDLEIRWPGDPEIWPARLPDLYAGEPLWVTARGTGAEGAVVVRGRLGGEPWETRLAVGPGRHELGIEKLFGRRKIAALMDGLVTGEDPERVKQEVVDVALEHGLVSRYTSLVAVERTPARPLRDGLRTAGVNPGAPAQFRLPAGATPAPLLGWTAGGLGSLALLFGWFARRRDALPR